MLKIGDKVELRKSVKFVGRIDGEFAKIEAFLPDVEGGVYLSNRIGGFRYWNVADLKRHQFVHKKGDNHA